MKSMIITGAAGNMGRAVVRRFAADGHKVYATLSPGENSGIFDDAANAGNIHTQFLNLTDENLSEAYVKDILAQDPALETAICIVGGWQPGAIAETKASELDKMYKLNFSTAFNIVRPLLDHFERSGRGQFVFIGARPAINPAEAKNNVAYALAKSLLFRLSEIINEQGKSKNIRAGVVIPSLLDTPQNRAAMPNAEAGEWVTPEAVADAIANLISPTGDKVPETVIKLYKKT